MSGREIVIEAKDGRPFSAYLVQPSVTPAPAVIVLQEIFGINAFVRGVADRLAAKGFVALAPDLFWRQEPGLQLDPALEADRNRAMMLFRSFDEGAALQDCLAARETLRTDAALCTGKVGSVGYCMGGKLAYLMAARAKIDAAVGYYGVGIQSALEEASGITTPLMLHIAGADHLCPPEMQAQISMRLQPHAALVELHIYEGEGHAFARPRGPTYNPIVTEKADASTLAFLNRHLRWSEPP